MERDNNKEFINIRGIIYEFVSQWKLFGISIFTALLFFVLFIKLAVPIYKVNANIVIKEDKPQMPGVNAAKTLGFGLGGALDINDELEVISSYTMTKQIVKALDINQNIKQVEYLIKKTDRYNKSVYNLSYDKDICDTISTYLNFSISTNAEGFTDVKIKDYKGVIFSENNTQLPYNIHTKYGSFTLSHTNFYKPKQSYNYNINICNYSVATESLMEQLEVMLASKKANVISMSIQGSNEDKCKDILNTLIDIYNKDALIDKSLVSENTERFITTRLVDLAAELSYAESEIKDYKIKNNFVDIASESEVMTKQLKEIQESLIAIGSQISIIDYTENYLSYKENYYSLLPNTIGLQGEKANESILRYNETVLERIKLLKTTSETNPIMDVINTSIDALRKSVIQSVGNVKEGLLISEKDLISKRDEIIGRFKATPVIEKDFRELERNRAIKETLVVFLLEKKEENAITKAITEPKAKVIDAAYKNNKPIFPKVTSILAIFIFIGISLPTIYILIINALKNTFESKQELESITTIPVLGEICVNENSKENIVITKDSVTPIAELFRLIRGNINFIINKKTEKVLLVTSTRSGEGKSFVSINIAMSLALISKRVLLVGLDIRNPKISEYMHLDNTKKGITNYLSDDSINIHDIIDTNSYSDNLDVITAGPVPPNPGELLLSDRLDNLINTLKLQYDYIVIDSAPVGMVSDSFSLNRLSDMTLYITRANYTEKNNLPFMESLIKQNRLNKMYLVVNGTDLKLKYGKTSYGYGYGVATSK